MHAVYADLPDDIGTRLADATAEHDFNKFWEMMRREKGSARPPLTEEHRRRKPPVHHPVFLTHPITGRKVLYANPGYTVRIDGLTPAKSDRLLAFLFAHQLDPRFRYEHSWTEGDVADVGQHRHHAQRGRRLPARPAPLHASLPGDGRLDLRAPAGR
jgi:taurine dioxygenase